MMAKCTFFSIACGTLAKTDHLLSQQRHGYAFQKIENLKYREYIL